MESRFLETRQIIPEILSLCKKSPQKIKKMRSQFPFIDAANQDFVTLVKLFHQIVEQDYPSDALIISLGESPAKMVELQTKMKSWQSQVFFLPVSKTVLHLLPIQQFYHQMQDFDDRGGDWEDFFEPLLEQNLDAPHVDYYIEFLATRGILDSLVKSLKKTRKIILVDFLMYGNSFVGFFTHLFVPLMVRLGFSMRNYTTEAVFLIDPDNVHHQIAEALEFLLQTYFVRRKIYFLEDYLSNAQPLADFFMDAPQRVIQQVRAPEYQYPVDIPLKKNYLPILLLIYMMIIIQKDLEPLFNFF